MSKLSLEALKGRAEAIASEKLLEKFQVEELEKRYEFGWTVKEVEVQTPYGNATFEV